MCSDIPSYPKVLTFGTRGTENVLDGPVAVQEKVDGSMFRFGIKDSELVMASHHSSLVADGPKSMFDEAIDYVKSREDMLRFIAQTQGSSVLLYCEYLQQSKHNTLSYARAPQNHLVLFDAVIGDDFVDYSNLESLAASLRIDVVPLLYSGEITKGELDKLLETPSYLGNETVEGIVIKNYNQHIAIGGRLYPIFVKLVREKFKERNNKEWRKNSGKSVIQDYIESFGSEARWLKAIQRRREDGELLHAPQDIGPLIKIINQDMIDEEEENIKDFFYKQFIKEILRSATRGFPYWYKDWLAKGE